jgi:integrase
VKESVVTTVSTRPTFHTPAYRRQKKKYKNSGHDLAFVRLDGKRIYLGSYDSAESRARYHQVIAEWEMSGRLLPSPPDRITVAEVVRQYLVWAKTYYVKHDRVTSEPGNIVLAVRPLLEMFGKAPASQFGPKSLKLVRQKMVQKGWIRKYTNRHVDRIKRVFKWAVAEELIPPSVYEGLRAVGGLRFGRGVRDNPPVQPASLELVEPVKKHVSRQVVAMIELQLLTGARPGEVVMMRPCDIDRSTPVWTYRPCEHKTEHHGHERVICLGPKAQEILSSTFLLRAPTKCCFSPFEAEKERYAILNANRKTPESCGNTASPDGLKNSPRVIHDHYTRNSYCRAIGRGLAKAFPLPAPLAKREGETDKQWRVRLTAEDRKQIKAWRKAHHWHPHQLRHNFATIARREKGLEGAQVCLGHSKADVTQIYAERDMELAKQVAMKIG